MRKFETARRTVFHRFCLTTFYVGMFCLTTLGPALWSPVLANGLPTARDDQVIVDFGSPTVWITGRDLLRNDGWGGDPPAEPKIVYGPAIHGKLVEIGDEVRFTPTEDFWTFGSGGFTYTLLEDAAGGVETESTAMVLLIADLDRSFELDTGFESGGSGALEIPFYADQRVEVIPEAAIVGLWGLRTTVPLAGGDAHAEFVPDHGGDGQDGGGVDIKMRCPDDVSGVPTGASTDLIRLGWWLGKPALRVSLHERDGRLEIDATAQDDSGVEYAITSPWVLAGGDFRLRVDWWRNVPGESDGGFVLWIDGVRAGVVDKLVNRGIDMTDHQIGIMGLPAPNAPVSLDFDDVRVWFGTPPAFVRPGAS